MIPRFDVHLFRVHWPVVVGNHIVKIVVIWFWKCQITHKLWNVSILKVAAMVLSLMMLFLIDLFTIIRITADRWNKYLILLQSCPNCIWDRKGKLTRTVIRFQSSRGIIFLVVWMFMRSLVRPQHAGLSRCCYTNMTTIQKSHTRRWGHHSSYIPGQEILLN